MTDRLPSPPTPSLGPQTHDIDRETGIVATTGQLAAAIEDALGCRPDDAVLESLLLELDRHGYVDWVTVTRTGAHVWDCSESADRIGAAIATAVADRLASWLEN
ncbi:hypothetical protein [Natrinema altunense]|uniref:Uncharacterized protein n=1 Tax=Natrinema altunense (strain JCM 12890 / CGMCC 1.3731 / AJ2) TaxID=1227494 RepID=L9ZUB7_NATA2|nr:hypothetical protein [Natrinema altunense]ELY89686.1 hypothetical protein C485_04290 [Natrinema altunense JCM 12890]